MGVSDGAGRGVGGKASWFDGVGEGFAAVTVSTSTCGEVPVGCTVWVSVDSLDCGVVLTGVREGVPSRFWHPVKKNMMITRNNRLHSIHKVG